MDRNARVDYQNKKSPYNLTVLLFFQYPALRKVYSGQWWLQVLFISAKKTQIASRKSQREFPFFFFLFFFVEGGGGVQTFVTAASKIIFLVFLVF